MISHDQIAKLHNVPSKKFEHSYSEESEAMKKALMEYMKTLNSIGLNAGASAGASPCPSAGAGASKESIAIRISPEGYPIAPCPDSWDKIPKQEMEQIYRTYIMTHYRE